MLLTTRLGDPPRKGKGGGHPGGAPGGNSPLITAGLCLGIGLGGFITAILFHQLLQWHHMLSGVVRPVTLAAEKFHIAWDGIANVMNLALTVTGVALLFRAGRHREAWSGHRLLGSMLGGWGLFNLIEGLLDHQLFGLHHVHPGAHQLAWDIGFLVSGAALIAAGLALEQPGRNHGNANT